MQHALEHLALEPRQNGIARVQIGDGRAVLDDAKRLVGRRQHGVEQVADYVRNETQAWAKVIQETGLTIQ